MYNFIELLKTRHNAHSVFESLAEYSLSEV